MGLEIKRDHYLRLQRLWCVRIELIIIIIIKITSSKGLIKTEVDEGFLDYIIAKKKQQKKNIL